MPKVSQSIELIKKSASISVNLCQSKKMQNKPILKTTKIAVSDFLK